jgi:hypothetical protein
MSGRLPSTGSFGSASLESLARFFPGAVATRIPVVVRVESGAGSVEPAGAGNGASARNLDHGSEATVIEFGTAREVFFASRLPLEAEDRVRLRNQDGSLDAVAVVVAVRLDGGQAAVAARFTGAVRNWIIQPERDSLTA